MDVLGLSEGITDQKLHLVIDFKTFLTPINLAIIAFLSIGLLLLCIVGFVIWNDVKVWQKDLTVIFFENRTNQGIGLGLGLQLIYYYFSAIILIAAGLLLFTLKHK
ncbi:MAG: hypothetical protein JW729_10890 [Bacteroidales bacterium]|nr:hypothetical protein [Bacteroidales bacterium]